MTFDPVETLRRLAALAAASPDDRRLAAALEWARREVRAAAVEAAA